MNWSGVSTPREKRIPGLEQRPHGSSAADIATSDIAQEVPCSLDLLEIREELHGEGRLLEERRRRPGDDGVGARLQLAIVNCHVVLDTASWGKSRATIDNAEFSRTQGEACRSESGHTSTGRSAWRCRIPAFVERQRKTRRHEKHIPNTTESEPGRARIEATNNKARLPIRIAYGFRDIDTTTGLIMLFCSSIVIPWPGRGGGKP